jgi:hypothetical protein
MENVKESVEQIPIPSINIERSLGLEILVGLKTDRKYKFETENEEAVNWIAFCYKNEDLKPEVLEMLRKHKPFIQEPEKLFEQVFESLAEFESDFTPLNLEDEIKKREGLIPLYKERIEKIVSYFGLDTKGMSIEQVIVVPCDNFLGSVESGYSIILGKTLYIMSHTENLDNFDHEFLHSIINPITEKCREYFESQEQAGKIFEYTDGGIDGYGAHPLSVLNEEIINTYVQYVKVNTGEITIEQLRQGLQGINEDDFQKIKGIVKGPKHLQDSFQNYSNLKDLIDNLEDYYENFVRGKVIVKNKLREKLLDFYRRYEELRKDDKNLSFEKFFLEKYSTIL